MYRQVRPYTLSQQLEKSLWFFAAMATLAWAAWGMYLVVDRVSRQLLEIGWGKALGTTETLGVLVSCAMVMTSGLSPGQALAGPTLLVDGATGQVLYAEEADQSWYPASLTKMMTAYVVFDAIKAGKLKLDMQVPISDKARGSRRRGSGSGPAFRSRSSRRCVG